MLAHELDGMNTFSRDICNEYYDIRIELGLRKCKKVL